MSCCLYWVILEERLGVRVLASAVDDSTTSQQRYLEHVHSGALQV